MSEKKFYLYPLWLRIWHWFNALLFLILIFSGINLQYADPQDPLISFNSAMLLHNIAGITLTLNYIFFAVMNYLSGNWKHYIPKFRSIIADSLKQGRYYLMGIFKNEKHPFETSEERKFNPLQQITYLKIMYAAVPLIIITGWALLFPEIIFEEIFGIRGLSFTAILHTILGFILSAFMAGHIYLATTGETVASSFKSMVTGWHKEHIKEEINETADQELV
jgi:thiosulfate reductase cytochrome b subunit